MGYKVSCPDNLACIEYGEVDKLAEDIIENAYVFLELGSFVC